ncbi:MAG: OmpA family protein, partial [Bacteroidota bacterium]
VGYADQKGNHQYNLRLSQQRARKIVDFLNHQGIDIKQVVRNEGKGSLNEEEEESRSRRVDVILRR